MKVWTKISWLLFILEMYTITHTHTPENVFSDNMTIDRPMK